MSSTDPPPSHKDELTGTEQPFVQHLVELRVRLIRSVYGVVAILVILMIYPGPGNIYDYLAMPLIRALPEGSHMIAIGVASPFFVPIKVTLLWATMLCLPWILYQIWAFVAPGLYSHEKRLVLPLVISSTLLFYVGAAFSYFIVFGQAFPEIIRMAPKEVVVSPDIESYLSFVMTMFLCFGLAFEVPVVVVVVVRMGLISVQKLKTFRGYYMVGAAAVAGLVTPPDPISMLALLVPLVLLFEVGLIAAQLFVRYTKAPEEKSVTLTIHKNDGS